MQNEGGTKYDVIKNAILFVLSVGALFALMRTTWEYLVWDACARPRAEAMLQTKVDPLVEELRSVRDAVDFNTFSQLRSSHGASWDQIQREWGQLKEGKSSP